MRQVFYVKFTVIQGVQYGETIGKSTSGKEIEKDPLGLIWMMNRR